VGIPLSNTSTLLLIQRALEDGGIEFTGEPLVNPGVVLHLIPSA